MSMFNNNNRGRDTGSTLPQASAPQASNGKRGMFSVIGPDMIITGNVTATADLHIDGRIDGDVTCGSLVQGTDSRVNGCLRAEVARLAGSIEGSVSVRQLTIERAARITGDVEYETISIENGASIDGRLKHLGADTGSRIVERPTPTSAPDISLVSSAGEAA